LSRKIFLSFIFNGFHITHISLTMLLVRYKCLNSKMQSACAARACQWIICIGSWDGAMENAAMRSGQPRALQLAGLCAGSADVCKTGDAINGWINGKKFKCCKGY
jgi:hypothetical protein